MGESRQAFDEAVVPSGRTSRTSMTSLHTVVKASASKCLMAMRIGAQRGARCESTRARRSGRDRRNHSGVARNSRKNAREWRRVRSAGVMRRFRSGPSRGERELDSTGDVQQVVGLADGACELQSGGQDRSARPSIGNQESPDVR